MKMLVLVLQVTNAGARRPGFEAHYLCIHTTQLQAQMEEVKQTIDSARKLELENRQLSERLNKLSAEKAIINALKAQVRRLEQEKEALQNEVQIARTEVCMYS